MILAEERAAEVLLDGGLMVIARMVEENVSVQDGVGCPHIAADNCADF